MEDNTTPTLFRPAVSLMNRMLFVWKFVLISVLFTLPLGVLSVALIREIQSNIYTAETEQNGLRVMAEAYELLYLAADYRDFAIIQRVNLSANIQKNIEERQAALEVSLQNFEKHLNAQYGQHQHEQFRKVLDTWASLNRTTPGGQGGPNIQFQFYDQLVNDIEIFVSVVTYDSKLVHDPHLKTFFLINILLKDIPHMMHEIGKARAYGVYALNLAAIDFETIKTLDKIYDDLLNSRKIFAESIYFAVHEQHDEEPALKKSSTDLLQAIDETILYFYQKFIEADVIESDWENYYQKITSGNDKLYDFARNIIPIVDKQLSVRIQHEKSKLYFLMGCVSVLLVIICYLYAGMYFSLTSVIRSFTKSAQQVAKGDLSVTISIRHADELNQLFNAFNEMVRQLRENQNQLIQAEKMSSLGSMIAGIAHEMNTPLGVAITASSHLSDTVQDYIARYKKGAMTRNDFEDLMTQAITGQNIINTNLTRCSKLINTFKQLNVYQAKTNKRHIFLHEFLETLHTLPEAESMRDPVKILIRCPENLQINVDTDYLSLIFVNLMHNALQHAFRGKTGHIHIYADMENDKVHIVFEDDGSGISEEDLGRIFEPFYTRFRHEGHIGLGLHIVYVVVTQALKGELICHSSPDKGTRFEITLPGINAA